MTYRGHIENGVIVPDDPIEMKDGTPILFEVGLNTEPDEDSSGEDGPNPSLTQILSRFAGKAQTLPEDAAENLDHYLYGVPRK